MFLIENFGFGTIQKSDAQGGVRVKYSLFIQLSDFKTLLFLSAQKKIAQYDKIACSSPPNIICEQQAFLNPKGCSFSYSNLTVLKKRKVLSYNDISTQS
jgi:hypothetical protein